MTKNDIEPYGVSAHGAIWGAMLVAIHHHGNEVLCEMESGLVLSLIANGKPLSIHFPTELRLPVPVGDWMVNGNVAGCYAEDKELYFQVYPEGQEPFQEGSTDYADIMFYRRKTDAQRNEDHSDQG